MIGLRLTARVPDPADVRRRLDEARSRAAEEQAQAAIDLTTQRMKEGRRPDGGSHRALADSTIARTGRTRPLVTADPVLSNPERWQRLPTGHGWRVLPPMGRENVPEYLEVIGYPIFADPDPELAARLQRIYDRVMSAVDLGPTIRRRTVS